MRKTYKELVKDNMILESDRDRLRGNLMNANNTIDEINEELICYQEEDGKTIAIPYLTLTDQMKADMIIEMWEHITEADIDNLVRSKKNYVHGASIRNK